MTARHTKTRNSTLLLAMIALLLLAVAAVTAWPVGASSTRSNAAQAAQLLTKTLKPVADTYVSQALPTKNFGLSSRLQVSGVSGAVTNSYIRFTISGLKGSIQSATLRVFVGKYATADGPAVYAAGNSWIESGRNGMTWNTQPGLLSGIVDNKGALPRKSWANYNVTQLISGNGTYTFALIADSANGVTFSSRQGVHPPQLVLVIAPPAPTPTPPPGPSGSIQHVFIVVMENHGYTQVWNTGSSPYITQLGKSFARATNYHAITHPSLPNYLDLYAGSNYGITTDCDPSSSCHSTAVSLADNLEAKGLTWKGYMESMPSPCTLTSSGNYSVRHDPFVYFDDIRTNTTRCNSHVVPFTALSGNLASAASTPNFAFITPDRCDDMHDCSVSTGDTWLKNHLPAILNSPACAVQKCLVALTWDEDDGSQGNHVLTIFAGSGAKTGGVISSVSYTHYSLLRTVENIFGLPTQTSNDAAASPITDLLR